MKQFNLIVLAMLYNTNILIAQNQPSLEVEGTIQIGDDEINNPNPGTIRWNSSAEDFEGWTGTVWKSLTLTGNEGWGNQAETEDCEIMPSTLVIDDQFGASIAISDDLAIIGARGFVLRGLAGKAYVFKKIGECWYEECTLVASDGAPGHEFGGSVSISGNVAVVGAEYNNKAYLYVLGVTCSGTLTQTTQLISSLGRNGGFGASVSISGDVVVVGEPSFDIENQGKAYLFERPADGWPIIMAQNSQLAASDGSNFDNFGRSVSVYGNSVIVGAPNQDFNNEFNQGKVYMFNKPQGSDWPPTMFETQQFQVSNAEQGDNFGCSVSLSEDVFIVGALGVENDRGKAYVFQRSPSTGWSPTESAQLIASERFPDDYFGLSVSISETTAVVGAFVNTKGNFNQGKAYVFDMAENAWSSTLTETVQLVASDGESGSGFGSSVSILGQEIFVGAEYHTNNLGKAYIFNKN